MPHPNDLQEALAPLAYLNAVEVFDQLFHDSVRRLFNELRPFVRAKPVFWGWTKPSLSDLGLFVLLLLATLLFTGVMVRWRLSVVAHSKSKLETRELALDPLKTLDGPGASGAPRVKVTMPVDISELPPVVGASRNIMLPGDSSQLTGPSKPRIVWRASVTVGYAWDVIGIASDGTVYVYDRESNVLDAIRDGKEIWAYQTPSPLGFDTEGRLWMGNLDANSRYSFNSRGEGGHLTTKGLSPNPARLQLSASLRRSDYFCRDGKVSKYAPSKRPWLQSLSWSVNLDGNCSRIELVVSTQTGYIYGSSDAGTLYAISPDGEVMWTVKQACKEAAFKVLPISKDDLVVA